MQFANSSLLPLFSAAIGLYGLAFILQIIAIVIVSCVLATKERKYKNIAHVSWVTAAISLFFGIFLTCCNVIGTLTIRDACLVLDYTKQ